MIKKFIYLAFVLLLTTCKQNLESGSAQEGTHTEKTSAGEDYFPNKTQPLSAKHFEVTYHGNYKVVKTDATFYAGGKTESGDERKDVLVLVQKGTKPPALTGDLQHAQVIYVPVETVAVNVQHSESFLRELGLENRINAVGGLYSYDNTMRNKAMTGAIGQIGYSWHSPPNMEVLLEREPEVFLMTLASMDHTTSLEKCRQLGIPTAAVFDWAEQDYLARAEWVKFYSLFFNAEEKADSVFQNIANRIEDLKSMTSTIAESKSAMWGYYTSKSKWLMQLTSFPAQYMRDAGLENVILASTQPNADGLQSLTTEELLTRGRKVDHWVIGDIHASPLPHEEIMSSFAAWESGQLYHNMQRVDPKTNTSDWYATAIVRPDTVLADLIKLAYPELLPGYQPVFMGMYDKSTQGKISEAIK